MTNRLPLLLVPGLLCDQALFNHQINALKSIADCHVCDTTRFDQMDAIARDLLTNAPPQFALAGLSMGGYVAMEIMRQAPERVLKLCLLDTSARPDTPQQSERRRLLIALSRQGQFKGVTPRLLPQLIHPKRLNDHVVTDVIMAMAERVGREAFLRQQTAIIERQDSRALLATVRCVTQVIGGCDDKVTPPDIVREIANLIPGSRLSLIEECGHLSALEKPNDVTQLMQQWLKV